MGGKYMVVKSATKLYVQDLYRLRYSTRETLGMNDNSRKRSQDMHTTHTKNQVLLIYTRFFAYVNPTTDFKFHIISSFIISTFYTSL